MRVWWMLFLPISAMADEPKDHVDEKYRTVTVVDVTDVVQVEGELVRPAVTPVVDRVRARFPSYVRLRDNFEEESSQSLDHVQ